MTLEKIQEKIVEWKEKKPDKTEFTWDKAGHLPPPVDRKDEIKKKMEKFILTQDYIQMIKKVYLQDTDSSSLENDPEVIPTSPRREDQEDPTIYSDDEEEREGLLDQYEYSE